jgi:hypothetical protein
MPSHHRGTHEDRAVECFLLFLAVSFVLLVISMVGVAAHVRSDRWNQSYYQLAKRFGGQVIPGGMFGRPSVRFRYGPTHALLNTTSRGGRKWTQMHVSWPDHDVRAEVHPRRPSDEPRKLRGTDDVATGLDWFDDRYVVRGNDERAVRRFLTEVVCQQIDRLTHLFDVPDMYVSLSRGRILIQKPLLLRRYADLEDFSYAALSVYDQAMLTRSRGITFVENSLATLDTEIICKVCGDAIAGEMVLCRRCRTPHHHECWEYYGSCAIYGCLETRWLMMESPSNGSARAPKPTPVAKRGRPD